MGDYTTGQGNLPLSDGVYTYEYDDEGQRTRRTRTSDGQVTLYTWDQRHRLTRVSVTMAVNGTPVTRTVDYSYDVFDRLIGRTESATNAQSFSEGDLPPNVVPGVMRVRIG